MSAKKASTPAKPELPDAVNPTNRPVVAVDIGQDRCLLAYLPAGAATSRTLEVPTETAAEAIKRALPEGGTVVMENTAGLEITILLALEADPAFQLLIAHHTDSAALRRLLKRTRKTDRLDADLIARLAALSLHPETAALVGDHLTPWPVMRTALLTRLRVRHLQSIVNVQTRAKLQAQRRGDPLAARHLTEQIAFFEIQKTESLAQITESPGEQERLLATLPGITPRKAAIMSAAIGEIGRFKGPDQLVRYLGLKPPHTPTSAGKPTGRPKIQRALQLLATELHMWALHVARFPERFGRMGEAYARFKEQGKSSVGMWTAKRLLIRTAWAILTHKTPYNPDHRPGRRAAPQSA